MAGALQKTKKTEVKHMICGKIQKNIGKSNKSKKSNAKLSEKPKKLKENQKNPKNPIISRECLHQLRLGIIDFPSVFLDFACESQKK